jgi:class 3 adenylate cyclase
VAGGDLDATVTARGGDEIAHLAAAFNRMTEGLRERERIKRTFKKYLAPDVVEYLLAHPEAQELGGTRKSLTVMFSDLVKFTALSEGRAPEAVVDILNTYFTSVTERLAARGGTVDKYIGDAIMAFFGAPRPQEDHAARACLAALDHLAVLDELSPRWKSGAWPELAVRIGINSGEMIIGNIGGGQAQDYTVIGDAVNLAERIESANKEYGTRLLVTEAVWTQASHVVDGREIDLVALVGRVQAVRVFEVFGPRGALDEAPAKKAAYALYHEGMTLMRARDFTGAGKAFAAAVERDPTDSAAAVMRKRTAAYAEAPPPEPWDGVFRRTSK